MNVSMTSGKGSCVREGSAGWLAYLAGIQDRIREQPVQNGRLGRVCCSAMAQACTQAIFCYTN